MGQCDDHGKRTVEQGIERMVDEAEGAKRSVDGAAVAQNNLPGEDPEEIAGPERRGDRDDPCEPPRPWCEGDVAGDWICQDNAEDCDQPRNCERTDDQD